MNCASHQVISETGGYLGCEHLLICCFSHYVNKLALKESHTLWRLLDIFYVFYSSSKYL